METIEKIEEVFNCKVCDKEIKEEEKCWIHEDKYCEDCINADPILKQKIRKCEKEMLNQVMGMLNEEGQKELMENFSDYFDEEKELIDIDTAMLPSNIKDGEDKPVIKGYARGGPDPLIVKYVEHIIPV